MNATVSIAGRLCLVTIFILSGLQKITAFNGIVAYMASHHVPVPQVLLPGAIAFLLIGGLSVLLGFHARIGAALLLIFLILATYYFHNFWSYQGQEAEMQMIHFMKNLGMAGAMLFIIGNGSGAGSLDTLLSKRKTTTV